MAAAGIPVPPEFTLSTMLPAFLRQWHGSTNSIDAQLENFVALIEKSVGKKFGDKTTLSLIGRSGSKPPCRA
jgi:hypothetical protein